MKHMKTIHLSTRDLFTQALIAGLYVALTAATMGFSYLEIQFRIAEFLMILCLFNPKHLIGLTIGCLIANFLGPVGIVDVLFGTLATVLAGILMIIFRKKPYVAMLWPSLVNGIIVGFELHLVYGLPLLLTCLQVFAGEFCVTFVLSLFLYRPISKNRSLMNLIS